MVNEEQLAEIIRRINENTASDEDLRIYNAWCNALQETGSGVSLSPARQSLVLRAVNRKLDKQRHARRPWLAAAAAVLLAVCGMTVYQYAGRTGAKESNTAAVKTIEKDATADPGFGMLTLADGRQLALSATGKGKLADEAGVEIIRTSDSTIDYHVTGNAGRLAYNTLATTGNRQIRVQLSDGTRIWLNGGTSMKFPANFRGLHERKVELEGEAYFDVQHIETAPFIIHSGAVKTTVLGTAFNIKAYKGAKNITVAVVRGKVRVEAVKRTATILTPNQQVTYSTELVEAPVVIHTDAGQYAQGWHQQDINFDDLSFQAVADILSQRFGVTIRFKNPASEKCTIKASFKGTQSLDEILASLCLISNSAYTKTGDIIEIDGEGCGK